MKKIFGIQFVEMRDIEDAKKAILETMRENREETDNHLRDIRKRLIELNKDTVAELNKINRGLGEVHEEVGGMEEYLTAFAEETFLHLPKQKANISLDYHHGRVKKIIAANRAKRAKQEIEQRAEVETETEAKAKAEA